MKKTGDFVYPFCFSRSHICMHAIVAPLFVSSFFALCCCFNQLSLAHRQSFNSFFILLLLEFICSLSLIYNRTHTHAHILSLQATYFPSIYNIYFSHLLLQMYDWGCDGNVLTLSPPFSATRIPIPISLL